MALVIPPAQRPYAPNYGLHTDTEGLLPWDWVVGEATKSRNYWIGTTRPDGRPHASPVWGIWYENSIYFGCDAQSRKAKNFAHQPYIVIHLESGDNAVMFEGVVRKETNLELLKKLSGVYNAKYNITLVNEQGEPTADMYTIDLKLVLAWLETDFPRTATRWRFV